MSTDMIATEGPRRLVSERGLTYGSIGAGRPVVLVHGWCLDRRIWMYQEERLASRYRVITPDLPGFGQSSALGGPYVIERYADELDAFLAELGLEQPVICGFAFGAAVAMVAASLRSPRARIGGLVLIGTPSAAHAPFEKMPRSMRRDWPDFARRSARAICKQPQSEATLGWLEGMFGAAPLPVAIDVVNLLAKFEPADIAASIHARSLFVHGANDDVVPIDVSRACVDRMPDARLEVVADSGHLVVLDQKERLSELLEGFLTTV